MPEDSGYANDETIVTDSLAPHPAYKPGAVPKRGNKVQYGGQYDNPNAGVIGGEKQDA